MCVERVEQGTQDTALWGSYIQGDGVGGELCFSRTKDVTVPYVPLETYPGSKIVHLILQGLDISEQNTR